MHDFAQPNRAKHLQYPGQPPCAGWQQPCCRLFRGPTTKEPEANAENAILTRMLDEPKGHDMQMRLKQLESVIP